MATSAASVQTVLETLARTSPSVSVAVKPAPNSQAVSGIDKSKSMSAAVQAAFDRISKAQQNGTKTDEETDHLRRMAELVQKELTHEIMVRSLSEADQTSSDSQVMERSASFEPVATAMASESRPATRLSSSAYEAQKQAYRENA